MIKAVFFDIDGTLVSFRTHLMPESTKRALSVLRKKGVKLFIATGRPYMCINNLGDEKFDGYVTLNGGTFLYPDLKTGFSDRIPYEDVETLVRDIKADPAPCAFVLENDIFINYVDDLVDETLGMIRFPYPRIAPAEEALGQEVRQVICFVDPSRQERLLAGMPGSFAARWCPAFADIIPAVTTKAEGLRRVCDLYGFDRSEIMAFGDGGNDVEMLRYAGTGVAMGNSSDEVKSSADYVTGEIDEDGLYNALEHFGLL